MRALSLVALDLIGHLQKTMDESSPKIKELKFMSTTYFGTGLERRLSFSKLHSFWFVAGKYAPFPAPKQSQPPKQASAPKQAPAPKQTPAPKQAPAPMSERWFCRGCPRMVVCLECQLGFGIKNLPVNGLSSRHGCRSRPI